MLFKRSHIDVSSDRKVAERSQDGSTKHDVAAERIALRKVDWHILPFIFILYMFSFLDR